jgi:hypothetical protein
MYKNHITKWKLDKRNKAHEIMAIVRKKRQRDAVWKASEFHVRGRVISLDDVHRYLKRKGISVEDAIVQRAATPPDLRCCTPDAVPSSPSDPEIFETPRRILVAIRSYIFGSVESRTWLLRDDDGVNFSVKVTANPYATEAFIENLIASYNFLQERSFERAGQFLIRGSALIRDVLLKEDPWMLLKLFDAMVIMLRSGWSDCCNITLTQFSNMAATILPALHPLRHIFNGLSSLDPWNTEDVVTSAWESFLDILEQAQGASSATTIRSRGEYIYSVGGIRDPIVAEHQLRAIVEDCKEVYGSLDYRYAEAMLVLGDFLRFQKQYKDAAAAAEEVIRCTKEGNFGTARAMWCGGMELLAQSQYSNFHDESAESTLRRVIDVRVDTSGWQNGHTLRLLAKLETWLTKFGKHDEAAEVWEQVAEILRQSNDWV